eukprot:TRINITY_DN15144_c0_g1_i1.p1 TRINITY_DN15144_c0_g1~~TRINITY_DN15144_c0_g1_i1.p1  ORF type:complete len:542 (+),score=133.92 TRINITY_DN15144_c0_g1_i1:154-1626(+)
MLRSLVGSEMCIRDRVSTQSTGTTSRRGHVIDHMSDHHQLARKISLVVMAALAVAAIVTLSHTASVSRRGSLSAESELFDDIGNPRVKGYTCGNIEVSPCSPIGGTCEGELERECECKREFSGKPCDWGPYTQPTQLPLYSHPSHVSHQEELSRLQLAYDFSNAVYSNSLMANKCPGFFNQQSALNTTIMNVESDDADTHAGSSLILPGPQSPSGQVEAIFGFRGTEFTAALTELNDCLTEEDDACQLRAIKTVLTDLDVGQHDLTWTYYDTVTGRNHTVNLGYVHAGFYNAVFPFLESLLGNASQYISDITKSSHKKKQQHHHHQAPIINVVGHSLGGALANLFSSVLSAIWPDTRIYLTTFGSPRVGSATWAAHMDQNPHLHILRVVNGLDIVTLIPTWIGLMDTVMHAGPQLTVGWDTVSKRCAESKLRTMKNMLDLLNPSWSLERTCAEQAVNQFHLNYSYNFESFLSAQGYTGQGWCDPGATLNF